MEGNTLWEEWRGKKMTSVNELDPQQYGVGDKHLDGKKLRKVRQWEN